MTDEPMVVLVLAVSEDIVPLVQEWFATAGFRTGPASGPTFAAEGQPELIADIFGAQPVPAADGGWTTDVGDEFSLDRLPRLIREQVTAVTLERPSELHGPAGPDVAGS
jgi:hypothetical protein